MGIDSATWKRLSAAASGFVTKNHRGYLAEASACLAETRHPRAALRLLRAMWGTYAKRPEQQVALDDVGRWLEGRLGQPNVDVSTLALELGWLRRLSQVAEHANRDRRRPARRPPSGPTFGGSLDEPPADSPSPEPQAPQAPPPPTELPTVFQAAFVSFAEAREARKTARRRQQEGKAAKDRLLAVRPTAPELWALAPTLVCSVLETAGFDAPFEAAERAHGAEQTFYVTAVEARDGKQRIRAITLTLP